jgi:N-methylhydantoinase B
LRVTAPEGSLVNALPPAAVAGGNVETSQRIVDVVLGALSKAIPDRIPAASSGTMNNLTIGGIDPRTGEAYAYYETVAGGMGARPGADGLDATHTHMTNSLNTPIEALEHAYPFRVERYLVRRGTGGRGEYRGGDGLQRDVTVLGEAVITVLSDRRIHRPWGLQGGEAGAPGENVMIELDRELALPSKFSTRSAPGATISIRTPGGGGFGSPVGGSHPVPPDLEPPD